MRSKPHIILIPGAWHTGQCYSLIVPLLESAAYPVTALTLPSVGAEPPITSLDPDIEHIRNSILPLIEQGIDVVVVMHSYGGVPGSSAMKGLFKAERSKQGRSGGVTNLVYVCAWMIAEGDSVRSAGGGQGGKGGPRRVKVEGDYLHHLDPTSAFYHDVPNHLQEQAKQQLKHHSYQTMLAPLTYPAYKYIPTTYLYCTEDDTIPVERQRQLVKEAGVPIQTFQCNASHSPFLSQPEFTARVIRHAAGENIQV